MGCNLRVERLLNRCPEVDSGDFEKYPIVGGQKFSMMVHCGLGDLDDSGAGFIFVRKEDGMLPYVEVYIWDNALEDRLYERFVICEGMCLPEEQERQLLRYARGYLWTSCLTDMDEVTRDIQTFFPSWNYPGYDKMEIGVAIEHIYYASHKSGPKGILYRAGLCSIAYGLYEYESYNVIGRTPEEIIGHGVPEEALRILNQPWFTVYYLEGEELERFAEVYKCLGYHLGGRLPSLGQWLYLEGLYAQARFKDEDFNEKVYENLAFLNKPQRYCGAVVDNLFGFLGLMDELGVDFT